MAESGLALGIKALGIRGSSKVLRVLFFSEILDGNQRWRQTRKVNMIIESVNE